MARARGTSSTVIQRSLSIFVLLLVWPAAGALGAQDLTVTYKEGQADVGARGANKSKSVEDAWVTSDAKVFLDERKDFIESGEYAKAIDELEQALDAASTAEQPEVMYFLGYAISLNGDTRDSLKQVQSDFHCTHE